MSAYIVKAISVIIWSAVKYIFGLVIAIASPPYYNFIEILIFNVGGGMIGVVVYLYLWDFIILLKNKIFPSKSHSGGIKITKRKRWLVQMINKYGIFGIVLLTPVLLTPPVGVLLCATIEKNKWKIKTYLLISFIVWTCLFYALFEFFGIRLDKMF